MAETKLTLGGDVALAVSAWSTSLAGGDFATSAIFDNTTSLFMDVLLGGIIELDATTPLVGETLDEYILGQYSDTVTDMTGGIDALFTAAGELVAETAFVLANIPLLVSVAVEATVPATAQGYHWGPIGVAQFFGGIVPKKFMLMLHNNTGGTLTTGSDVNTNGITYTTT